jgi:hypothetical protein
MEKEVNINSVLEKWNEFYEDKIKIINNSCVTKKENIVLDLKIDEECKRKCLTEKNYHLTDKICTECKEFLQLFRVPIVLNSKAPLFYLSGEEKDELYLDELVTEKNIELDIYVKKDYLNENRNYCYSNRIKRNKEELYKLDDESKNYINSFLVKGKKYFFDTNKIDYSYITESKVFNYVCVSLIMKSIMLRKDYTFHLPPLLYTYICGDSFNLVEKTYNMGSGNLNKIIKDKNFLTSSSPTSGGNIKLNKKTCLNIIKQLTCILSFLTDYHFNHGNPSIEYLNFEIKKEDEKQEVEIKGVIYDVTLKLSIKPSFNSSISYKSEKGNFYNFRCFSKISSPLFNVIPVESFYVFLQNEENTYEYFSNQNIPYVDEYMKKRYYVYKIGEKFNDFKKIYKDNGIPIFSKSFTFVCFLLSLLKERFFYESFFANEDLKKIWDSIWHHEDNYYIIEKIHEDTPNNFDTIFDIVKDVYIRVDFQKYFLEKLTQI